MDLGKVLATIALPALVLAISIASWFVWFNLSGKSNELKDSLLGKFALILTQLDDIAALQEDFNQVCAARSLAANLDSEDFRKFVALTKAAYSEIDGLPGWRVLGRYPKYWHHAEVHARYFAPLAEQLRDTIKDLEQTPAP